MADERALALLEGNPAIKVIHDPSRFPEARDGLHLGELDGAAINKRDELFDALEKALELPEWFGRNWDALSDALRDLSWLEGDGVAVLVTQGDELLSCASHASAHLLEIWTSAAVVQAKRGRTLQLFLAMG